MDWYLALPIAIAANIVPVPLILLFFGNVEKYLRRFSSWSALLDKLFARTRRRADAKIRRYQELGLIFFVAIPLPVTGAWTGSLIAYLFALELKRAFICITAGVVIAGVLVTAIVSGLLAL
jgi:uncharacterized membrane protein